MTIMSRLEISPEQFRILAYRAADLAAEYLSELPEKESYPQTSGQELLDLFGKPLPEEGIGEQAMDALSQVLDFSRANTPRFFGYVLGSGEPVAAIGDLVTSVVNQNVTAWRSSPAAATIERVVVGWLGEFIGCNGFAGSLTGGGSSANLMGLAIAREAKAPANDDGVQQGGVVYASSEVHMSIPKAVALLGLGHHAVRYIPVDSQFRMKISELERAIAKDRAAGKRGIAVVGTAGTVNTGSIDPLDEMATVARANGLWFHIDGAYGALAAGAVPEKFRGLAQADSLSLDPHKWLYQPLDCGCLLYRDPANAQRAFSHSGDYTKVLNNDPIEGFAFFEESMELSRRFRALKIWLSMRFHGAAAFRASIADNLRLAHVLADAVRAQKVLELMAPVELSAVCFRYRPEGASDERANALNAEILRQAQRGGQVFFSNATIDRKFCLRACITNHRSTEKDVEAVVQSVLRIGETL
jgi:aromatic-L-amino-acid decarboxylase